MDTSIKLQASTIAYLLKICFLKIEFNSKAVIDILNNIDSNDFVYIEAEFGKLEMRATGEDEVRKHTLLECLKSELNRYQYENIKHLTNES